MNKSEFLVSLRSYLNGRISDADVDSNIDYYSAYIDGELAKGRTEAEVMDELGDPSLIARTLIDSVKRQEEGMEDEYAQNEDGSYTRMGDGAQQSKNPYSSSYRESYGAGRQSGGSEEEEPGAGKRRFPVFLIVLIVLLIIFFGFSIFSSIFRFGFYILRVAWPVILIIIIAVFFTGRRRY